MKSWSLDDKIEHMPTSSIVKKWADLIVQFPSIRTYEAARTWKAAAMRLGEEIKAGNEIGYPMFSEIVNSMTASLPSDAREKEVALR